MTKRNPKSVKVPGDVFGNLTLIEYMKGSLWRCRCACGKYTLVLTGNLTGGNTTSCGCQQFNKKTLEQKKEYQVLKAASRKLGIPMTPDQVARDQKKKVSAQEDALLALQKIWG